MELTAAQRAAIGHVRARADRESARAGDRIDAVLRRAGLDVGQSELSAAFPGRAPIALNFHPDRIAADGRLVAESLLVDGVYRNQFETGISNGGLTAFPGGDRDGWERNLFGSAYHSIEVGPADRPRYGGLNLMGYADGPCPRFGSCHVRLLPHVAERSTFTFGDSFGLPSDIGTAGAWELIVAATLEEIERTGAALGSRLKVVDLVDLLLDRDRISPGAGQNGRALDHYVEVQVHGPVRLGRHADALVADPSFRDTAIERQLQAIAERYRLELAWHNGFEINAREVPADFRGPAIPQLAGRIADQFGEGSPVIHAERIGQAARSLMTEPERWIDWAPTADTLQHIKQLWHTLVAYGRDSTS